MRLAILGASGHGKVAADAAEQGGWPSVAFFDDAWPGLHREGLPKGLVEAAACGRAVVTTDVPGCRDAIEPDVTGVLVPVKSAPSLADALQALIEEPERRMRMGKAGRELAERAFSIDRIVEQHLAIYKELLEDA